MLKIKEILKKLCEIESPSGFEKGISSVILEIAGAAGMECKKDALGNLIVHRPGIGKRVMIDAHMDTIGFLATYIDEKGYVRFDALGGISASDISGASVKFLNGTQGVISYEQKTGVKDRKISSMYIDIGARDAEQARVSVLPGDAAVFASEFKELCGNRISSAYLDNKIGCAIGLYALLNLKKCDYDVWMVFSAQEEVGCRGAKTAAYSTDADFAIVLDVTDSCDTPGYDGYGETKMGGGAAIKIMDRAAIAHPEIVEALIKTSKENNIPYQRDIVTIGGTDAGSIQLTKSGIPSGGISVPVRYMHTPNEVADMDDIEAAAKLLIETLENQTIIL